MASTLMIDDRLQIDKFNVTTFTGDYGINHDGFRKDVFIDGSYTRAIDETPEVYTDELQFKPKGVAGNIHLKTISPNYAPHGMFPTRKFEYSDGTPMELDGRRSEHWNLQDYKGLQERADYAYRFGNYCIFGEPAEVGPPRTPSTQSLRDWGRLNRQDLQSLHLDHFLF